MKDKSPRQPKLWTARPVEETIEVYRDWADSYDEDLAEGGYHTPRRIAEALAPALPPGNMPVLDFGCGTGISGAALRAAGIAPLHGTDITPEMLDKADPKGIYERLWLSQPGQLDIEPGAYRAIVAAGVVSLGAAPPETLDLLIGKLTPGGLLALSFNDPTLDDGSYDAQLDSQLNAGRVEVLHRAHGPHLDDIKMGSDVILLRIT